VAALKQEAVVLILSSAFPVCLLFNLEKLPLTTSPQEELVPFEPPEGTQCYVAGRTLESQGAGHRSCDLGHISLSL
jgi:hypothetical protein